MIVAMFVSICTVLVRVFKDMAITFFMKSTYVLFFIFIALLISGCVSQQPEEKWINKAQDHQTSISEIGKQKPAELGGPGVFNLPGSALL